ncbi:MAG: diaminopimelate epimerase [Armatimonadetes bacterium]|nr:diaminopimelate epimerase [Armatimonadota bacterium]
MRFAKAHGLGNDFILVESFSSPFLPTSEFARAACHRQLGIGADGLLTLSPSDKADFKMTVHNSDGTTALMCGNGIRCAALAAKTWRLAEGPVWRVETESGVYAVEERDGQFRVDMGLPTVERREDGWLAKVGNLHWVWLEHRADFETEAPVKAREHQANAHEAVFVEPFRLRVRTFELGAGFTQACGTGACASVAAWIRSGGEPGEYQVDLPGGSLLIEQNGRGSIYMTGPAVIAYLGSLNSDFRAQRITASL